MPGIAQIALLAGLLTTAGENIACADDLLPPCVAGKWNRRDTIGVFNGKELYALIDGGASLFFEYGFVRAYAAEYGDEAQRLLSIELYEMSDPAAAFGVFSSLSAGIGTEVASGLRISTGEGFAFFWKGAFMGSMSLLEGPPAAPGDIAALGACIGAGRESALPPALVRRLLAAGCDTVGMVLFKGKLGLLNHSPFRSVQNLQVESGVTGTKGSRPFVVFTYADSVRSHSAYSQWVKDLPRDSSTVVRHTERETRLRDGNGEIFTISLAAATIIVARGIDASDIVHALTP